MMKKNFFMGFISGALIFGIGGAFAASVIANPNPFLIQLNGQSVNMQGYNIEGNTYFKLRDIANIIGTFNVGFNDNTIQLSKDGYEYNNETPKLKFTNEINDFFIEKGIRIPEFQSEEVGTDEFMFNFIFDYYTGIGDPYSDSYISGGFNSDGSYTNGGFKWNENEVKAQYKLFFGKDMPEYYPNRTMLRYEDGYYIVGASNYGEVYYNLHSYKENNDRLSLQYALTDWDGTIWAYATFELKYADNDNGYIIESKTITRI